MSEKRGKTPTEDWKLPPEYRESDAEETYWPSTASPADLSTVLNSPFGGELARPFARSIFLRHFPVMGVFYVDNIEKLLKKLKKDDPLILIREPENEHDEWAILVMTPKHEKLGYIPRRENKILARLMDAGKSFRVEVSEVDLEEDNYYPLWIAVYMED